MIFFISNLLLLVNLITKIKFYLLESTFGILNIIGLLTISGLIVVGTYYFYKTPRSQNSHLKFNLTNFILFTSIVAVVTFSMWINLNKKTVLWDAVALYDARSIMMQHGLKISDMVDISKYDPQNSYYYSLYPPYTSVIHLLWRSNIDLNVSAVYTIYLILFCLSIYLLTNKKIGGTMSLLLVLVSASNPTIFSSSISEYTNMPFTLHIFVGVMLIDQFLEDRNKWKFMYGSALIITSMWIRFLEPVWLGVFISILFYLYLKKDRTISHYIYTGLIVCFGIIEYLSWSLYVKHLGPATEIVSFSFVKIFESVFGIFAGSLANILSFFIKSWGVIFAIYLLVISIAFNSKKYFFGIFVVITTLIYFSGLYFVSFQSVWWSSLGNSLVRSTSFLIPIAGYILIMNLKKIKSNE